MERPTKFEHTRFLGDKRTQLVYDLGICFGPDTLAEARNRGYKLATPGLRRRHRKPRA